MSLILIINRILYVTNELALIAIANKLKEQDGMHFIIVLFLKQGNDRH